MMDLDRTLVGLRQLRDKTTCFACSGCGMEHNCSDDGCRIIRSSIEQLQKISKELATSEAARTELWKQLVSARQELAEAKAERDALAERNRSAYEIAWGCDIPSPTVPEYVELHEGMTRVMEALKDQQKEA